MITVFIDTNILHCANDELDKVRFAEKLQAIIDEIEINDIYTEVKLVIPKIVICELFEQQMDAYNEWINKLDRVKLPNLNLTNNFNYKEFLENAFREEIITWKNKLVKIEIVDFPSGETLEKIIYRSIYKNSPFEGKEKQSDKGFKDVIIWECLKAYKMKHISDTVVLYCNDHLLSDPKLKIEYYDEFRDELFIEKKGELISRLTKLLDTSLVKTFANQLEERIKNVLSKSNELFVELLMNDNTWRDGDRIIDFDICNCSVIECNDEKVDNKIMYVIKLDMVLKYRDDVSRENYKIFGDRCFDVYYDFVEDKFYLKEYDALTMGRVSMFEYEYIGE